MFAEMIEFVDNDGVKRGGIMVDKKFIICGCCGGVFEVEEVGWENVMMLTWIDISEEILGN